MDFVCLRCTSVETVTRGSTVGCRDCGHWATIWDYGLPPPQQKPYNTACPTGCKKHPRHKKVKVKPI